MTTTSQKYPVKPNMAQLIILSKSRIAFADGYSKGQIKTDLFRKNGNTYFEFYPEDVEQGDFSPRPEFKNFVCNENFVKRTPSGSWSGRRNQVIILPRHKLDLPDELRGDNHLTDWISVEGQKAFIKSALGSLVSVGDEAMMGILSDFSRIGMSKSELEKIRADVENYKKMFGQNPTSPK